jgi:hypothetical protein
MAIAVVAGETECLAVSGVARQVPRVQCRVRHRLRRTQDPSRRCRYPIQMPRSEGRTLPFKLHSRPIRHRIGPLLVHAANKARFGAVAEPHGVIHIRPSDVTHWQIGDVRRLKRLVAGTILGGDWDLKVRPRDEILAKNLKFLGLKEHFVDGVPWARTRLFTERYPRGVRTPRKAIRGCKTLAELAEYYEVYDRLFDDLRRKTASGPPARGKKSRQFRSISGEAAASSSRTTATTGCSWRCSSASRRCP